MEWRFVKLQISKHFSPCLYFDPPKGVEFWFGNFSVKFSWEWSFIHKNGIRWKSWSTFLVFKTFFDRIAVENGTRRNFTNVFCCWLDSWTIITLVEMIYYHPFLVEVIRNKYFWNCSNQVHIWTIVNMSQFVKDELLGITCLSLTLSRVLVSAKLKLNDILLLDQVIYECFLN